jgi:DNA-directed RNA polymerase subunit M/transcription elongation factor TFIIS
MLRTNVTTILESRLGAHLTETDRIDLEKGIYNASLIEADSKGIRKHWENPDFAILYKSAARRCIANLDPVAYVANSRLLTRLKEGEFPAHQVPFMSARELYPEHWQSLADEHMKRETLMLEGPQEEGSSMFTCNRCKKSKTRYWEMQTRSADEPMTIFIRCLNCGKEWRQ